jgi:hypothetical protein
LFGADLPQCRFKREDDVVSDIICSHKCIAVACSTDTGRLLFCFYGNVNARRG